jgi:2-dehydro-3-deoxyphosphogluconate aldolase/(4S)-4-hydroxy-2-oxoglutarate aldolase
LAAPFPAVEFVPTGGISQSTMTDYLELDCVAAVGGSWMFPAAAVTAAEYDVVQRLAAEAVAVAGTARTVA